MISHSGLLPAVVQNKFRTFRPKCLWALFEQGSDDHSASPLAVSLINKTVIYSSSKEEEEEEENPNQQTYCLNASMLLLMRAHVNHRMSSLWCSDLKPQLLSYKVHIKDFKRRAEFSHGDMEPAHLHQLLVDIRKNPYS